MCLTEMEGIPEVKITVCKDQKEYGMLDTWRGVWCSWLVGNRVIKKKKKNIALFNIILKCKLCWQE